LISSGRAVSLSSRRTTSNEFGVVLPKLLRRKISVARSCTTSELLGKEEKEGIRKTHSVENCDSGICKVARQTLRSL